VKPFLKITIFLIAVTFITTLLSCKKAKNDVIPDVYVDFYIDLADPEFVNLTSIGCDTVDARTNNWGTASAGYDGNGIIIFNTGDTFYAFDRTCPHDFAIDGSSIKVKADFTIAVCPKCGTTYSLSASGTPASGVGQYPLKNYKTSFDGRFVRVWNR
jgi:nitrite reductase/ring-hydroxylating ferredoxin subunit